MKPVAAADSALWHSLRTQLHGWTGIVVGPRDADSALSTLGELARSRGQTAAEYLRFVESNQQSTERQRLIDRVVIGSTWFMREAAGISALVSALRRELGTGRQARIWSAGCSTGQEPYGLAMALVEAGLHPRILATDINSESLRIAAAAVYPMRSLSALPATWQARYTTRRDAEHGAISSSISSLIHFTSHNLASMSKPPEGWDAFDAVVCRNVLMYFDRPLATEVVRRLSRCCRPGGCVLLSAAERPLVWMTQALEEVDKDWDVVLLRRTSTTPASRLDERPVPKQPPVAVPALAPPRQPPRKLLSEISGLMESADLARALELVDSVLAADPLLAEAHLLRGLLLKRRGALKDAAVALRCARFLFSDEAWLPPYHLALILEQLGELDEAAEAYRHARAVVFAGGRSGMVAADGAEEVLALTVAEACAARLRVLRTSSEARPKDS